MTEAVVRFDRSTVDLDAIQRASYSLARVMSLDITATGSEYVCTLFPQPGNDPDELAHLLRTEVIDQCLRIRIARDTEPLRNLIFALAYSQTGLTQSEAE